MLRLAMVAVLLLSAIPLIPREIAGNQAGATDRTVPAPTSAPLPQPPRQACPVTRPGGATPPDFEAAPHEYWNDTLLTGLWPEGRVVFEPGGAGYVLPDGSLGMKWGWVPLPMVPGNPMRPGDVFSITPEDLTISGRRLDAPAPPLRSLVSVATTEEAEFFPTRLVFSTPGCWEVTAHVRNGSLTFVTLVVLVGDGPDWRPETIQ